MEDHLVKLRVNSEKMLGDALAGAEKLGVPSGVCSKLLVGKAEDVILVEAVEGGFDLIVMGDRGMNGLKFVLGSVSRHVVDASRIPVLIVK